MKQIIALCPQLLLQIGSKNKRVIKMLNVWPILHQQPLHFENNLFISNYRENVEPLYNVM